MEKSNNNVLYGIIGALALIIVLGLGYLLGQNGNGNTNISSNNTPLVVEAGNIGLDEDELNKCIAENKFLDKINSKMKVGQDTFGITGTPGNVLINNETGEYVVISGAYPKEAFIENIDNLLTETTGEVENTESSTSSKDFKENTDSNTLVLISDSRDNSSQIDQILDGLKEIEAVKNMTIIKYDFSDNGTEEFLKENNIKTLPAIIFAKKDIDPTINKFLVELKESTYSLNIGATFNPFAKLSSKGFKTIDLQLVEQIKASSYIDGNKSAKITWLEYSDLECPFCQRLHNSDVESSLKEKYGDNLNIVFNHFPLVNIHKKAIAGANILECVGELGGDKAFYKILKFAYTNKIQE